MYSALLFVYSLYKEVLVRIFKDPLCDIRPSEINQSNAQLQQCLPALNIWPLHFMLNILKGRNED